MNELTNICTFALENDYKTERERLSELNDTYGFYKESYSSEEGMNHVDCSSIEIETY